MKSNLILLISIISILLVGMSMTAWASPLHTAVERGNIAEVRMLLEKGADVNAKNTKGETPLLLAAAWERSDIAKLLIEKGADVNTKDNEGFTPLIWATNRRHLDDIAKLLIEKGADVNAKTNKSFFTPLRLAALTGSFEVAKLLIQKGADVDLAIAELERLGGDQNALAGIKMLDRLAEKYKTVAVQLPESVMEKNKPSAHVVKSDIDELPVIKAKPNKNAYAIVIGIENYRQKLPMADFAVADAKTMTEYLTKVMGYPEENVVTLTNAHAAKSDFEKYFEKWLPNNVEKDSSVFIYYSGHGAPSVKTGDAYLVPYDGDPSFIEQTGYSLKKLYESLNKLQAKEIIVALDSCFSGAGGKSVIAKGARPLVMNLEHDIKLSKNMIVMSASSGDQISSTYEEKGHGLFTYFMLKGIKNEDVTRPDGSIKMDDLYGYIKPQVERIARKQYNNEQTPQLIGGKKNR